MHKYLLLIISAVCFSSCASIPKNGATISTRVSEGIGRMQTENEKVIKALADVERGVLDEKWESIYDKTEAAYRIKHNLTPTANLNREDRINIAVNATAAREEILNDISVTENNLLVQSRANAKTVVQMN